MDMEIFDRLKDYITIYGDGKVNINTASKEVLLSLGLDKILVDKILFFRKGEDDIQFTQDDNVFEAVFEIVPKLSQFSSLSVSEVGQLTAVRDRYLATDSSNFMAKSLAELDTDDGVTEVIAIIDDNGKILYWREF